MSLGNIYTKIALCSPYIESLLRKTYWYNIKTLSRFNPFSSNSIRKVKDKNTNFDDVIQFLKNNGIGEGSLLIVHSSYGELINTGLSPNDIINKLLDLIGPTGTLAMPVIRSYKEEPSIYDMLSFNYESIICKYDVKKTPVISGLLPYYMLKRKDSVVSHHPLNPLCAIGPLAKQMMEHNIEGDSPSPHGPNSSWKFCHDHHAKIAFIGVDSEHYNTMIHVSDEALGNWRWTDEEWYQKRKFLLVDENNVQSEITIKERKPKWGLLHYAEKNLNNDLTKNNIVKKTIINDDFMVCVEDAQQFVSFLRNQKHKGYPYY